MNRYRLFWLTMCCVIVPTMVHSNVARGETMDPVEVFNQRILPIFQSEKPSSCVQCHLSSVDLKNYILPSSDATFASLRDQGLVDINNPEASKILTLIRMGEKDADERAKLIHETTRNAEFEAFSNWIIACCHDQRMRSLPPASELARPRAEDGVIRHARKSRIVDSFVRNVWTQRMRCFPCHTPYEVDATNPKHRGAVKRQEELKKVYDDATYQRLTLFRKTPEETLAFWIESSRATPPDRLPLLNLDNPGESLILQKPLSKLPSKNPDGTFEKPSYRIPVSHMGGLKLHPHDHTYKAWITWINDYARTVKGEYQSVDELPPDNWLPTQKVLRVTNTPETWQVGQIVQLFVYARSSKSAEWAGEPIAFTQGTVTPRRVVNGALIVIKGHLDNTANEALPSGDYLIKAYLDHEDKIAKDPSAMLNQQDFVGQTEIKAKWRDGFRFAEKIPGRKFIAESP